MTDPDTIASAVLNHVDCNPSTTDGEASDGVPKAPIDDVPTAPMRFPDDAIPNPFVDDENWEDAETVVRKVPQFRKPHDPTGCMM